MYGLDNTSGISVMPPVAPAVSPTPLWFTEGGAGQSPSYPGQDWFNMFQAEHLNVLADAGISPDKSKLNQLATAIKKLIATGLPEIPVASLFQKGIVQLSSAINSDSETLAATSKAVKTANDAALKIVNNLSEIAAAGPGAVLAAITNLNLVTTVNNANGALQVAKNLSDLNDIALARTNLRLGNSSVLNIANNAEMAAGSSTILVPTVAAVMSLFSKRSFGGNNFIRIPDVPGGLIVQWGYATGLATGTAFSPIAFPISFPVNPYMIVTQRAFGSAAAGTQANPTVNNAVSQSGFSLNIADVTSVNAYWLAIGY